MDRILNNAFKQNLVGSYASGATSIQLASISNTVGNADYLPDPTGGAYNLIFYSTVYGDPASARNNSAYMIGRVTAIDYGTNTLTITTAQENTADVAMDSAWACLYGATSKMFEDIRTGKQNILSEGAFVDGDKTKLDNFTSRHILPVGGTADDTTEVQGAINSATSEDIVILRPGVYSVSQLSLTCNFHMMEGAELKFIGTDNTYAIKVDAAVKVGSIYVDANLRDAGGVSIPTAGVQVDHISVKGIRAGVDYSLSLGGVVITADNVKVNTIYLDDNENAGHTNDSRPPGVRIENTLNDSVYIGKIDQTAGAACLLTSDGSGETTVEYLRAEAVGDNGCYLLGGRVTIGEMYYAGNDEALVCGNELTNVGKLTTFSGAIHALALTNCGDVNIDKIVIIPDASNNSINGIANTRDTNTASGKITISSVIGEMYADKIFGLDTGTVEYFTLGEVKIVQNYTDLGQSPSRWFDLRACAGFDVRNVHVKIIDPLDALTVSDVFTSNVGTPMKESYIHDFNIETLQSDGVSVAPFIFRGAFASELIETKGVVWRNSVNAYVREISESPVKDSSDVVPTSGTWRKGKVLIDRTVDDFAGWICTVGGSPGTWERFRAESILIENARPYNYVTSGHLVDGDTLNVIKGSVGSGAAVMVRVSFVSRVGTTPSSNHYISNGSVSLMMPSGGGASTPSAFIENGDTMNCELAVTTSTDGKFLVYINRIGGSSFATTFIIRVEVFGYYGVIPLEIAPTAL